MGGAGFGQGLVEGLQQSQSRQLQMQQLKLQQDLAKFQQKHMETQDQMAQLNLQSLQQKMMEESQQKQQRDAIPGQAQALTQPTLGPMDHGPEPDIDRRKLTSLLMSAQQAGQDPNQLLELMSIGDPRISAIRQSLLPKKLTKVGEGETLVNEATGESVAKGRPKAHTLAPGGSLVREGEETITAPPGPTKPPDYGDHVESAAAVYLKQTYGVDGNFTSLLAIDPIAAKKVREQAIVDEPSKVRAAGTEAGFALQEKKILSPEEANKLGVPFGTTNEQAHGIMPINAQQREALAHYDTARVIINDIKQYSDKINTAAGGLKGRAEQSAKLWGAWTQSNTDAALLMSKAGELASVARSLGEKGALANQDVARAAALIPSVIDTRDVAQTKLKDMLKIINEGEMNYRKSLGIDAKAPGQSTRKQAAAPAQEPADPLAHIPVPKGLTPQQEKLWRETYNQQKQSTQQKMQPKAKP